MNATFKPCGTVFDQQMAAFATQNIHVTFLHFISAATEDV